MALDFGETTVIFTLWSVGTDETLEGGEGEREGGREGGREKYIYIRKSYYMYIYLALHRFLYGHADTIRLIGIKTGITTPTSTAQFSLVTLLMPATTKMEVETAGDDRIDVGTSHWGGVIGDRYGGGAAVTTPIGTAHLIVVAIVIARAGVNTSPQNFAGDGRTEGHLG